MFLLRPPPDSSFPFLLKVREHGSSSKKIYWALSLGSRKKLRATVERPRFRSVPIAWKNGGGEHKGKNFPGVAGSQSVGE